MFSSLRNAIYDKAVIMGEEKFYLATHWLFILQTFHSFFSFWLARQALYYLNHTPSSFAFCFSDGILLTPLPPPIS
jgi:hypothetical protein